MSICRGFSPEELQAATPWELPDLAQVPRLDARVEDVEVEQPPAITAEEIEAIQKQAYEEAASAGRQEGFREGSEAGYAEGYQKGLDEGRAEGRQAVEAELEELRREQGERFAALLASLQRPLADVDGQVEQELLYLAAAIAKQVVRRELTADPGLIVAAARSAIGALPSAARDIVLHVHPEDAELLNAALSLAEGGSQWKLVEDPSLTRGGCRVVSEFSQVDATVEKRLAQAIAQVLGDERESPA